jgi:hypothetical protein
MGKSKIELGKGMGINIKPRAKNEKAILYCAGVDKELVDWLRTEYKRLGYSWLHEYFDMILKQLKDQSEGGGATGGKVRKSG